jgi:hypothetical protein
MANTNAPFGFRQTAGNSGPLNFRVSNSWKIASGNGTAIYFGDAVVPVTGSATGYIKQATASTVQLIGIFYGCSYFSTSQKKQVWSLYWPGSDATGDVTAFICDDPAATFTVQAGGSNVGFALVGQNIQLNVGSGSTTTGTSGMYVETAGTAATLPFKIVAIPNGPTDPDGTLAYNWVTVAFNNQIFKQTTGIS